jgi:hypothetical protein
MQISETAIWGSPAIARYSKVDHHYKILRRLKLGQIPGAKCVGGRWVIERADLDRWLASRKQKAAV